MLVMLMFSRLFVFRGVSLLVDIRRLVKSITVLPAFFWVLIIFCFLYFFGG
jgi:hypothetical protein